MSATRAWTLSTRQVACLRDARHLELGGSRRDIGVEAARRGGHEIDRDRSRRIFRLELFGIVLDPVDQRLASRPQVRSARIRRVVGRRDRLRRIVRVGIGGRRGAAAEVFVVAEVLAYQLGADHLAVFLDEAPIGLMRKDELSDPGHSERIDEAGDHRHDDDHHDRRSDLSQHEKQSSGKANGGDGEVDQLDADERHDDAAHAVDQQVSAQDRRGARRPIGDAAQTQRD